MPSAPTVHNVGQQISRPAAAAKPALRMGQVDAVIVSIAPLKEHVHPAHVARLNPAFNRKAAIGPHVQTRRSRDYQVPAAPVEVEGLADLSYSVADSAGDGRWVVPHRVAAVAFSRPPTHQSARRIGAYRI